MKTLLQLVMVGILGLASVAHAGAPLCWSLSAPGVGVSATTLKLYANDMGGQFILNAATLNGSFISNSSGTATSIACN